MFKRSQATWMLLLESSMPVTLQALVGPRTDALLPAAMLFGFPPDNPV